MIGIPGSGKSTWIEKNLSRNIRIISKDQIRIDLGIMKDTRKAIGTKEEEEKVKDIFDIQLHDTLDSGKSFVIDNTNLGTGLEDLVNLIRKFGYRVIGVRINTPLSVCIQRRPEIPRKTIEDMYKNLGKIKGGIFDTLIDS